MGGWEECCENGAADEVYNLVAFWSWIDKIVRLEGRKNSIRFELDSVGLLLSTFSDSGCMSV